MEFFYTYYYDLEKQKVQPYVYNFLHANKA